jgi:hypothetical protein
MRLLGYPPGWMEEARISHSGLTLYDSQGRGKCYTFSWRFCLSLFDLRKMTFVAGCATLLCSINPPVLFGIRKIHLCSEKYLLLYILTGRALLLTINYWGMSLVPTEIKFCPTFLCCNIGHVVRLSTAVAWVQSRVRQCGICVWQSGAGAGFLQVSPANSLSTDYLSLINHPVWHCTVLIMTVLLHGQLNESTLFSQG